MTEKAAFSPQDLALYIGQEFQLFFETMSDGLEYEGTGILASVDANPDKNKWPLGFDVKATLISGKTETVQRLYYPIEWVRPILRPISDLTKQEAQEIKGMYGLDEDQSIFERDTFFKSYLTDAKGSPNVWFYLLSIGIDLFGWIDAGLAVDRKTLQNNNP